MEQIEAEHGALRSDVLAYTGGGGEHRVFSAPSDLGGLPGKLGPGIDVKLNGYIIVEPSGHVSGRSYTWEGESDPLNGAVPSPLPDWLRGFSAPVSQAPTQAAIVAPGTVRDLRSALAHMREALARGARDEAVWNERMKNYQQAFPELAAELHGRLRGELPAGWGLDIPVFSADAKGTASAGEPVPPQTARTIGDTLSAKGVSWAWYAGGWAEASRDGRQDQIGRAHV